MKIVIKPILMALIPVAVAAIVMILLQCQSNKKDREIDELKEQLAKANVYVPLQRDTIRDSVPVVTQTVVEVVPRKMKEALAAQEQTIRDLRLKVKQLEAAQTTSIKTADTVRAKYQPRDSCFSYSDQWADLSLRLKDTTFYYNIRDSLATYVYREYRHRFLWWRWGVKGYKVKVVNFNPHSTIRYNSYVKPGK